jgi:hypothetical protein
LTLGMVVWRVQAAEIMSIADTDRDGSLSREEFWQLAKDRPDIVSGAVKALWSRFGVSTPRPQVPDAAADASAGRHAPAAADGPIAVGGAIESKN